MTGALTGTSITGTSIVKSGGTALQFLKADGSIDTSTYLTTTSAGATYLPLAGGTLTGALTGTSMTATSLLTPNIDTATAVVLNIGTSTQTALTIGRTAATTNLRGLTIITTGNITPSTTNVGTIGTSALTYNNGFFTALSTPTLDTATAVAQNIGILTQTALTIGRVAANTTINGLVIAFGGGGISGNFVPNLTTGVQNLGSATNRWNVFAQTLTLPNTAGIRTTNFNSTSFTTVGNTITQTALFGTGNGSLSITDVVGTTRTVKCCGSLGSLAAATIAFSCGSAYGYNNTYTIPSTVTAVPFELEITYVIKTSTSYVAHAKFQYGTVTPILTTFTQTISAPAAYTTNLYVTWGAASVSNTITANIVTLETLA